MKVEISEGLRVEIEDAVADAFVIDALRRAVEYNDPEKARPIDVEDFTLISEAAKVMLDYFGAK